MRFLLLGTSVLGASYALPFVDLSTSPDGQPVPPVEVAVLDPVDVAPAEGASTPMESVSASALDLPRIPELLPGGEGMRLASLMPFQVVENFFTPDVGAELAAAAEPVDAGAGADPAEVAVPSPAAAAEDAVDAVVPEADVADLPPAAVPADLPPVALAEVVELAPEILEEMPEAAEIARETAEPDDMPAPVAVADSPSGSGRSGSWLPGGASLTGILPFGAISALLADGDTPTPAPAPVIASPGVAIAPTSGAATGSFFVGNTSGDTALIPLSETVGALTLDAARNDVTIATFDADPAIAPAAPTAPAPSVTVAEADPAGRRMMEVTATFLNLRQGPSSGHSVVVGLVRGTEAEVIETAGNGWVRVRVPGSDTVGWAFERYLSEKSDA